MNNFRSFFKRFADLTNIFPLIIYLEIVIAIKSSKEHSTFEKFGVGENEEHFEDGCNDSGVIEVQALLMLAKIFFSEIVYHQMPSAGRSIQCIDPQNILFLAKKLGIKVDLEPGVSNFQLMFDNHRLCYSYDILQFQSKEKDHITGCMTANEIVSKLFVHHSSSSKAQKNVKNLDNFQANRMYCCNIDTMHLDVAASVCFVTLAIWFILALFHNSSVISEFFKKITGARLLEWINSPIRFFIHSFSAVFSQQTRVTPNAIAFNTRIRFLIKLMKKDLTGAVMATKSILKSCFQTCFNAYQHFSNHTIFYKLADVFTTSNKIDQFKRKSKTRLEKLSVVRALSRSKPLKIKRKFRSTFRPKLYLQQLLKKEAKIPSLKSYDTIGASSCCSSSDFIHNPSNSCKYHKNDTSFEILTTEDFQSSQSVLSDASSGQPLKTQPLSQWDMNTPNIMFENSLNLYEQTKQSNSSFCWSNSSYEVLLASRSASENISPDEARPELRSLSISSRSSSNFEQDLNFTSITRSAQNSSSKFNSPKISSRFSKCAPPFLPCSDAQPQACFQFNPKTKKTISGITNGGKPSTNFTTGSVNVWNKPKTKQNGQSSHQEVWSSKQNCARALGPFNQNKNELNINQLFPKLSTGVCGWPIHEPQHFSANVWDRNRKIPVLNSLKRSYATDSSFNFNDSRFNSLSPEMNRFQINQTSDGATGIKASDEKDVALCDFSHLLNMPTNVQPIDDKFKPRATSLGDTHFSQYFDSKRSVMSSHQSFLPPDAEINLFPGQNTKNPPDFQRSDSNASNADRLMQIFKSQRDEINNLRTKIARDSVALTEHQALLQEVGKDKVEKAQEIHKRSNDKLARAQNEEILRYNALLDKKILNLVKLQRRCNEAKAREYKLKTHLQWKPYEIS